VERRRPAQEVAGLFGRYPGDPVASIGWASTNRRFKP
jgi:hypothetical protein